MSSATIGVVGPRAAGERRVALVPEVVGRMCAAGRTVLVEKGAGDGAWLPDQSFAEAGAEVLAAGEVYQRADVLLCVGPPAEDALLRSGQIVIGLLQPARNAELIQDWAARGVTVVALEALPRTLSRAQPMDALTSQANVSGYKAAVLAADTYGGYLPMLMTAAGTVKPAAVLVLGAGVAGLQAIATARRLGAVVTGYDIRPEAKGDVTSLGARFLEIAGPGDGAGTGGYARALSDAERREQQLALDAQISKFDVVIATAGLPDRRPPQLVSEAAVHGMRAGAVVVDTMRGPLGGNVEVSELDTTVTVPPGVLVVGAGNLPSAMPSAASAAYARNVLAVLDHLLPADRDEIDLGDEIADAIVVATGGQVRPGHLPAATKGSAA